MFKSHIKNIRLSYITHLTLYRGYFYRPVATCSQTLTTVGRTSLAPYFTTHLSRKVAVKWSLAKHRASIMAYQKPLVYMPWGSKHLLRLYLGWFVRPKHLVKWYLEQYLYPPKRKVKSYLNSENDCSIFLGVTFYIHIITHTYLYIFVDIPDGKT